MQVLKGCKCSAQTVAKPHLAAVLGVAKRLLHELVIQPCLPLALQAQEHLPQPASQRLRRHSKCSGQPPWYSEVECSTACKVTDCRT